MIMLHPDLQNAWTVASEGVLRNQSVWFGPVSYTHLYDDYGIVYKTIDKYNNVKILYKEEFVKVNIKRIELSLKAKDLYPVGYDLNSLFTSFEERKLEKDIARGSDVYKRQL